MSSQFYSFSLNILLLVSNQSWLRKYGKTSSHQTWSSVACQHVKSSSHRGTLAPRRRIVPTTLGVFTKPVEHA
jgi:hypothetical protein